MPKLSKKLIKNKNSVKNKGKIKRKSQKKVNKKKYTHKKRGGASPSQHTFSNSRHRIAQESRMQRIINRATKGKSKHRLTMSNFNPEESEFIGNNNNNTNTNKGYADIGPETTESTEFVYKGITYEDWSTFVESENFTEWLKSKKGQKWFKSEEGQAWVESEEGKKYFASLTEDK